MQRDWISESDYAAAIDNEQLWLREREEHQAAGEHREANASEERRFQCGAALLYWDTWKKSQASNPEAWARRNEAHVLRAR